MKNVLYQLAIAFGCISISWANAPASSTPASLTSVRAIRSLTNAQAGRGLPVAFQATVTYCSEYRRNLFVQDGSAGLFVNDTFSARLVPGDRVLIKGTTASGYSCASPKLHPVEKLNRRLDILTVKSRLDRPNRASWKAMKTQADGILARHRWRNYSARGWRKSYWRKNSA